MIESPALDTTGRTDVWDDLTRWLRAVPDRSTVKIRPGRYGLRNPLGIVRRRNLTIVAGGVTLCTMGTGNRTRSNVDIIDSAGIVIHELGVEGGNQDGGADGLYDPDLEAQHGFNIVGSPWTFLFGCTALGVWGDFAYVGKTQTRRSETVWIEGLHGRRSGRQGIAITDGTNVHVVAPDIGDVRRTMFDLEPNTARGAVVGVTLRDGKIGRARLNFLSAHGKGDVSDISVRNMALRGMAVKVSVNPPAGQRRHDWSFDDVTSDTGVGNPQKAAMLFEGIDGLHLRRVRQPFQRGRDMRLARVTGCTDVDIDVPYW